jgi:azurin
MNAQFQHKSAQRLHQLAHTARAILARILATLVLLPLLAACVTPGAAQQTVVKAVARAKPISEIPTPAPMSTSAPTSAPAPTSTPARTATPAPTGKPVSIGTNGGEWQFDTVALEIPAGEEIALTFHNGAKTTPHNWLLISGDDYAAIEVNKAGETAGATTNYIPDDTRIIARTAGLVKGGQSETVTFIVPAAGAYVYLCTFPGHFELGMQGVLTVR